MDEITQDVNFNDHHKENCKSYLLDSLKEFFPGNFEIGNDQILEFNLDDDIVKIFGDIRFVKMIIINTENVADQILFFQIMRIIIRITQDKGFNNFIVISNLCNYDIVHFNTIDLKNIKHFIFIKDKFVNKIIDTLSSRIALFENQTLNYRLSQNEMEKRNAYIQNLLRKKVQKNLKIVLVKFMIRIKNALKRRLFKTKKSIDERPTIFHVTHWKAGSQWLFNILRECEPEYIKTISIDDFTQKNITAGFIYTPLYLTYDQFSKVNVPKDSEVIVIFRDLRDTLVSLYFSIKYSHTIFNEHMFKLRKKLYDLNSIESGLNYLLDLKDFELYADIQRTWLASKRKYYLYEDLIKNDVDILLPILERFLIIPKKKIRKIIIKNRFDNITKGRKPGEEEVLSHQRKGIQGDWQNYFTESVSKKFKSAYGDLLIKLGYEKNDSWH